MLQAGVQSYQYAKGEMRTHGFMEAEGTVI